MGIAIKHTATKMKFSPFFCAVFVVLFLLVTVVLAQANSNGLNDNVISLSTSPQGPFFTHALTRGAGEPRVFNQSSFHEIDLEFALNLELPQYHVPSEIDIRLNYLPRELLFGDENGEYFPLPCININDDNDVVFYWDIQRDVKTQKPNPTTTFWSFKHRESIPINGTQCIVNIRLYDIDLFSIQALGAQYLNIPRRGVQYGYSAFVAETRSSNQYMPLFAAELNQLPYLQQVLTVTTLNDCTNTQYCIVDIDVNTAALKDSPYLFHEGFGGTLFNQDEDYTCYDPQSGTPLILATSAGSQFNNVKVITATPTAYQQLRAAASPNFRFTCTLELSKNYELSGKTIQTVTAIQRGEEEGNTHIYLQPIMSNNNYIGHNNGNGGSGSDSNGTIATNKNNGNDVAVGGGYAINIHTPLCIIEHECVLTLSFPPILAETNPLLRLDLPMPQIMFLKTNKACLITQYNPTIVWLQLTIGQYATTMPTQFGNSGGDNHDGFEKDINGNFICQLYYIPKEPTIQQLSNLTPDYLHYNVYQQLTLNATLYGTKQSLNEHFNYLQTLVSTPSHFNLTLFDLEQPVMPRMSLGMSPIIRDSLITVDTQCDGVFECAVKYNFLNPLPFAEIRLENYLYLTDVAKTYPCINLAGVTIAEMSVQDDLRYAYLRPTPDGSPMGITYGECTLYIPVIADRPAAPAAHQYLITRFDMTQPSIDKALVQLEQENGNSNTIINNNNEQRYDGLLIDKVQIPNIARFNHVPYARFVGAQTHGSFIAFEIKKPKNYLSTNATTMMLNPTRLVSYEFFFDGDGYAMYEIANVLCHIPPVSLDNTFGTATTTTSDIMPSCSAIQNSARSILVTFDSKTCTTTTVDTFIVRFSLGVITPKRFTRTIVKVHTYNPITQQYEETTEVLSNVNDIPSLNDFGPVMWSPQQDAQTPSSIHGPSDAGNHVIHLFTNHTTNMRIDLHNAIPIGSIMVFQLYYSNPSAGHTALRWEVNNIVNFATHWNLEIVEMDETCPFCYGFKVLPSTTDYTYPELQKTAFDAFGITKAWVGRHFNNFEIGIKYLDTRSTYNTMLQTQMLFKIIVPARLQRWPELHAAYNVHDHEEEHTHEDGDDHDHEHDNDKVIINGNIDPKTGLPMNTPAERMFDFEVIYDHALSPTIICYNHILQSVKFYHQGFEIQAGLAGPDPLLSSTTQDSTQMMSMIQQLAVSPFSTEQASYKYTQNIKNVNYSYKFPECGKWGVAMPTAERCTIALRWDDGNYADIQCADGRRQTTFYVIPPAEPTPATQCMLHTRIDVEYLNGQTQRYIFITKFFTPPAIPAGQLMFNRNALVCAQNQLPILYAGGPGMYLLTPPNWDYKVDKQAGQHYTIEQMANGQILINVANTANSRGFTQSIPIYARLTCSVSNQYPHRDLWQYSITQQQYSNVANSNSNNNVNQGTTTSRTYTTTPIAGYYLYRSPQDLSIGNENSDVMFHMQYNGANGIDIVYGSSSTSSSNSNSTNDNNVKPAVVKIFFAASYPASTWSITIQPVATQQVVMGVHWRDWYQTYEYFTEELIYLKDPITNELYPEIRHVTKRCDVKVAPNQLDPVRIDAIFEEDIERFSFRTWDVRQLQGIDDAQIEIQNHPTWGLRMPLTLYEKFDGLVSAQQCQINTQRCVHLRQFPITIQEELDVTFQFDAELYHSYPSYLTLTRDVSATDRITIVYPQDVKLIDYDSNNEKVDFLTQQGFNTGVYDGIIKTQQNNYRIITLSSDIKYNGTSTQTIIMNNYIHNGYRFSIPTQLNATTSRINFTNIDNVNDNGFNVTIHFELFSFVSNTAREYTKVLTNVNPAQRTDGIITRPVVEFSFPIGISYNLDDIQIKLKLTRDILFGQELIIYPLPIPIDYKKLSIDTQTGFTFECISRTHPTSPFVGILIATSRTRQTIVAGTDIILHFPTIQVTAESLELADLTTELGQGILAPNRNDTNSWLYLLSPGLGKDLVPINEFNIIRDVIFWDEHEYNRLKAEQAEKEEEYDDDDDGSSSIIHRNFSLIPRIQFFEPIVPIISMTYNNDGYLMPCKVGHLCKLNFALNTTYHKPFSLRWLQYMDIAITFGRGNDDVNSKYFISSIIPEEYQDKTFTADNGWSYRYTYSSARLTLTLQPSDVLLSSLEGNENKDEILKSLDFPTIPIYVPFITPQTNQGVISLDIIRYQSQEALLWSHAQYTISRNRYEIVGSTIYHTDNLRGPIVLDENTYKPLLFPIRGGAYCEEPIIFAISCDIAGTHNPKEHPDEPHAQAITFEYLPQQDIDGLNTLPLNLNTNYNKWINIISNPAILKSQMRTALQLKGTGQSYIEITQDHGMKLIIDIDMPLDRQERLVLQPNPDPTSTSFLIVNKPIRFDSGFIVKAWANSFDPDINDITMLEQENGPYLTHFLNDNEKDGLLLTGHSAGFTIFPKPLIRIIPRILKVDTGVYSATIPYDTDGYMVEFTVTFQMQWNNQQYHPSINDIISIEYPEFYETPADVYECVCLPEPVDINNHTDEELLCNTVPLIYNGEGSLRFDFTKAYAAKPDVVQQQDGDNDNENNNNNEKEPLKKVPTSLQCMLPVKVRRVAVDDYMVRHVVTNITAEPLGAHVDFYFGDLKKSILLNKTQNDDDGITNWIPFMPTVNTTANTLPMLNSFINITSPFMNDQAKADEDKQLLLERQCNNTTNIIIKRITTKTNNT